MTLTRLPLPLTRPALRLAIIAALLGCIFALDTLTHFEIAIAVYYIVVIFIAVTLAALGLLPKRGVFVLATLCVALTVLSYVLTPAGSREAGLMNGVISISAIGITTYLAMEMVTAVVAAHESRAQLARIARLTHLGELTTSIAHEVNQPLAAIVTSGNACLRWLELDPPNVERSRLSAQRIVAEAHRASEIITRVRRLARGDSPVTQRLALNDVIVHAVELARSEIDRHAISLRVDLAADLPPVLADHIQIQQVIANLVLNAVEAMTGRTVRQLAISSRAGDGRVVVAVADTGVGLPVVAHDRLFDAFWTTKGNGVGIGLTISRSIVEAHGGRIWATPRDGGGAVFQFSFPAASAAAGSG